MKSFYDLTLGLKPKLPKILEAIDSLHFKKGETPSVEEAISNQLPHLKNLPLLKIERGSGKKSKALRVGVVFSGGQASGGHNVIAALFDTLKKIHPESVLVGFLNGPSGILENQFILLDEKRIAPYRNQGGFDLIGSGRTKIETPEQFEKTALNLKEHSLDGLVIIGGDDSNTNAALLANYFIQEKVPASVIGVPKTIDGDLKNDYIEASFGFDTAAKTYSETIGAIAKDALSAKKYFFFIKLMWRSASHIALECALQTHPNLCLISEEVQKKGESLKSVSEEIARVVALRQTMGKNFGIVLIPEGIIEFLPDVKQLIKELNTLTDPSKLSNAAKSTFNSLGPLIQEQLLLDRDPHGNVQVSKIETERLFIDMLNRSQLPKKLNAQPLFLGYEGRSCTPSHFDANYCYALGCTAALLIREEVTGYMAAIRNLSKSVQDWEPMAIPQNSMMHMEERKGREVPVIKKALVDLNGNPFKTFSEQRKKWEIDDLYSSPGPIQFFGPPDITETITQTLHLENIPCIRPH